MFSYIIIFFLTWENNYSFGRDKINRFFGGLGTIFFQVDRFKIPFIMYNIELENIIKIRKLV